MYVGYDDDNCRWVGTVDDVLTADFVPRQEQYGYYSLRWHMFGSAHDADATSSCATAPST